MTYPIRSFNRRLLLIDDDEGVRDNFMLVLRGRRNTAALQEASAALFDDLPAPVPASHEEFELDVAENGSAGLEKVRQSLADEQPYAAIFCDIRMPGIDGVETVRHIQHLDQRAEIVLVTAYSDYDLDTIVENVGANVSYFVKPFSNDELRQVATKAVLEWNKARELEALMRTITSLQGEATNAEVLLRYLLVQLCTWMDTDSAALAQLTHEGKLVFRLGVGALANETAARDFLQQHEVDMQARTPMQVEGATCIPITEFGLAIALTGKTRITPDRLYLVRVFLEYASVALKNAEIQNRLLEAERMAAVGQAVGYITHDLRSQLSRARMVLELLERGIKGRWSREDKLKLIGTALDQASHLISDTLEFSRGTLAINQEENDLAEVIASETEYWERVAVEKGIQFVIDMPPACPCRIDPARIRRVINNLVKNALEAVEGQPDALVRIVVTCDASEAVLLVEDNGPGIPEELRGRLFQPFASRGKQHGTGFGLAITRQLVESHGGTIQADDRHTGTRFRITLPL